LWGRLSSLPVHRAFQPGVPNGAWKGAGTGRLESLPHKESLPYTEWVKAHFEARIARRKFTS